MAEQIRIVTLLGVDRAMYAEIYGAMRPVSVETRIASRFYALGFDDQDFGEIKLRLMHSLNEVVDANV